MRVRMCVRAGVCVSACAYVCECERVCAGVCECEQECAEVGHALGDLELRYGLLCMGLNTSTWLGGRGSGDGTISTATIAWAWWPFWF